MFNLENQNKNMNKYFVIGLMSGTSLDGLDIAYCEFDFSSPTIDYIIIEAETIEYSIEWKTIFTNLEQSSGLYFAEWDRKIGAYFGDEVQKFISKYEIERVDFVASHGHTIFHQPASGFTVQVGHGASLSVACNLPVVCDFRSLDVALGGQGAPLVPIGDHLLFKDYSYCLNLGGIANISYQNGAQRIAFDVCPANMVLNFLVNKIGLAYDKGGELASEGNINADLLTALNGLEYYELKAPKSLGREWVFDEFIAIVEQATISLEDKLATICEHIAIQIEYSTNDLIKNKSGNDTLLATGGGAFNLYLMERIKMQMSEHCQLIIPDEKTVKFKEALIFALLGVLRWRNEVNSLSTVTGASKDSVGGCIYFIE